MSAMPATLLIVDNDVHVRKLLEVLLRGQGYQTLTAGSGKEALAMVMQHAPDLILLDIQMPDMDGYAVARHFKGNSATANIPIIMLSAQSDQKARIAGLEAGVEDFLGKRIVSTELWLRVRNLLRLTAFGDYQADHSLMLEEQLQQRTIDLIREHQSTLIAQWRDNLNAAGQNDDSRIGARDLDIQVNEFWNLLLPALSGQLVDQGHGTQR